jgi:hypothetical protein
MKMKTSFSILIILSVLLGGCLSTSSNDNNSQKIKVGRSFRFEDEMYLNQSEVWTYSFNITEGMQPWNFQLSIKWIDDGDWRSLSYDYPDIFEIELNLYSINQTLTLNENDSDGDIELIWGNSSYTDIEDAEVKITCLDAGDIYNIEENGTIGTDLLHIDIGNSFSFKLIMRYYIYIDEDEATIGDLISGPG